MVDIYNSVGANWLKSKASDDFTADSYSYIADLIGKRTADNTCTVLDMCCGYGRLTIPVSRLARYVIGFDNSPTLISSAIAQQKQSNISNISFICADMLRMPFQNNKFDLVMCMWASFNFIININQQIKIFSDICSILSPRGIAVIDIPNSHISTGKIIRSNINGQLYNYFDHSRSSLVRILNSSRVNHAEIDEFKFGSKDRLIIKISKNEQ